MSVLEKGKEILKDCIKNFEQNHHQYYEKLMLDIDNFKSTEEFSDMDAFLLAFYSQTKKHFFTICSKDSFSNFENEPDYISFIYTPLNDHSRHYMNKGDLVFCYRQGQFNNLDEALDKRGIYGVGIVMSQPEILFQDEEGHNRFGVSIFIPKKLERHLELRNIQLNPNTINLTPYNGNRNDALQHIPDVKHYSTLLSMICRCNPKIKSFYEKYTKLRLNDSLLPVEEWRRINFKSTTSDNLILYGPPGTGKTYKMQNDYICKFAKENCFVTTFHQSFSYEEFVEGLKPRIPEGQTEIVYEIEYGIFYEACEQAAILVGYDSLETCIADSQESRRQKMREAVINKKIVLLCIDEINRANVSSVFGDLISLVESSKRLGAPYEMTVKLPYSKKDFGVPANLMIVGTMNTADRSIQLLDSALRRRFKFIELLPDYECLKNKNENDKAERILRNINNRIRALLDKDHQIGHSYFIGKNTNLELLNVIKENIIPLLEEYFYNETEKIRRVLNETDDLYDATSHVKDYFYVLDEEAKDAVGDTDDFNEEKSYYKLNEELKKELSEESAENFINHLAN